jgi:outer membrane protein
MTRTDFVTRVIRRVVAATLLLGFVLASAPALAKVPPVKRLAVVDMQRVLNETKAGKRARKELEASSKAKQQKLDKKRARLEADVAKLKDMKGDQLAAAQEKLQRESMELQSMLFTLQTELSGQEAKLLEKMYRNSRAIVAKLAKSLDLDLVLVRDQMTVIYTQGSLDITDTVIKRYDKKHPK